MVANASHAIPGPPQNDGWYFRVRADEAKPWRRRSGPYRASRKYARALGYGMFFYANPVNQGAVVKSSVSMKPGAWYAHGAYLQRHGAQREGRGLGFDAEGKDMRVAVRLAQWQRDGDPHMFKIMLSPDHADRIDLAAFTRSVMRVIENDVGRPLEWIAMDHHNTTHEHVHICLRGVDRNGQALLIHNDYLWRGVMHRAGEVLTLELGWKREAERERTKERALERSRFGQHDRALWGKLDRQQRVRDEALTGWERRRLQKLTERGLAWEQDGVWELAFQWKEKMQMAEEQQRNEREPERTHEQEQEKEQKREQVIEQTRDPQAERRQLVRAIDDMERDRTKEQERRR